LLGDWAMVRAVVDDYRTAPIPDDEQALFGFIEKVNGAGHRLEQGDVDVLHQHGWSDEAILDAVMVCGLFQFYNCVVDGTGVPPLSDRGHAASGRRIAKAGYLAP
jgi:alkylhydroperoxidase family enzyme